MIDYHCFQNYSKSRGFMKYIIRILNYLSKFYYLMSLSIALIIAIFLLAGGCYYIGIFAGSGFANYILESTSGPGAELKLIFQNFFENILPISIVLTTCLLTAATLKGLRRFVEAKSNNSLLTIQRATLSSLPKYILISYLINIFLVFFPLALPENNNKLSKLLNSYGGLLLPEFGNALGLVLAFVIYSYSRSLNEQEIATAEIDKLKQEADLVI